jgi:hypothetical protein
MLQHYTEELEETFVALQTCVDNNDITKMGPLLDDAKSIVCCVTHTSLVIY